MEYLGESSEPYRREKAASPEVDLPGYEKEEVLIATVNYHVLDSCNMHCDFCFATFADTVLPSHYLPKEEGIKIVQELVGLGFRKINFAGGEPFMLPHIADLVKAAKAANPTITTSIITNGSIILQKGIDALKQFEVDGVNQLDILAMSVDSVNPATLDLSGRRTRKRIMSEDDYLEVCRLVKQAGIRDLKINTVVSEANWLEDLRPFIRKVQEIKKLLRWKILGMDKRAGQQADETVDPYEIGHEDYSTFVCRNSKGWATDELDIVPESSYIISDSYTMVSPKGSFFWTHGRGYKYGASILEVGIQAAYAELRPYLDPFRYLSRMGHYGETPVAVIERRKAALEAIKAGTWSPPRKFGADADYIATRLSKRLYNNTDQLAEFWQQRAGGKLPNLRAYLPLLDEDKNWCIEALEMMAKAAPESKAREILDSMYDAFTTEFLPVMAAIFTQEYRASEPNISLRRALGWFGIKRHGLD